MSTMMGAPAGGQEDMFAKLESMRAVITEVNTQFKDPVRPFLSINVDDISNARSAHRMHTPFLTV